MFSPHITSITSKGTLQWEGCNVNLFEWVIVQSRFPSERTEKVAGSVIYVLNLRKFFLLSACVVAHGSLPLGVLFLDYLLYSNPLPEVLIQNFRQCHTSVCEPNFLEMSPEMVTMRKILICSQYEFTHISNKLLRPLVRWQRICLTKPVYDCW